MAKYILKRLLASLLTILLVVCVVFLLLRMMPSDYFFTEDELMKFNDQQKDSKLERLGLRELCPECHGAAVQEDGTLCPRCHVELRCPTCAGTGKVNVSCPDCGGTGSIRNTESACLVCGGDGLTEIPNGEGGSTLAGCTVCEGTGRVTVSTRCATCAGRGKLDEQVDCSACENGMIIRAGTGYVDRSKLAQLGDFFLNMLEFRAYTPNMINKAEVEVYTATAYISKDYSADKKAAPDKVKAVDRETGNKKTVYVTLSEGDSTKDAYIEGGKLFVKKSCEVLSADEAVPAGMTAFPAVASDGTERRIAVAVGPDEHAEDCAVTLTAEHQYRDYTLLDDGDAVPDGMTEKSIRVGDRQQRVAIDLSDDAVFQGIEVTIKEEDRTVPFITYVFARLRGENPFEDVGNDGTYYRCHFNLGKSIRLEKGQYVIDVIGTKIGTSMEIGLVALAISLVLGVTIGVLQARNSIVDGIGTGYTVLVNAVPHLVIYTIIMMLGAIALGLPMRYDASAPNAGLTKILPIICLSIGSTAGYMLWTRRYMVDELNKDYIRLARLKGLSETQVMFRHVLKNAFVPLAQYLPYSILLTVGGSLLVERFFAVPGMGPELTNAIGRYDVNLVQGIVLLYATMGILGVFLGDLLMTIIDPRIKLTGKGDVR